MQSILFGLVRKWFPYFLFKRELTVLAYQQYFPESRHYEYAHLTYIFNTLVTSLSTSKLVKQFLFVQWHRIFPHFFRTLNSYISTKIHGLPFSISNFFLYLCLHFPKLFSDLNIGYYRMWIRWKSSTFENRATNTYQLMASLGINALKS